MQAKKKREGATLFRSWLDLPTFFFSFLSLTGHPSPNQITRLQLTSAVYITTYHHFYVFPPSYLSFLSSIFRHSKKIGDQRLTLCSFVGIVALKSPGLSRYSTGASVEVCPREKVTFFFLCSRLRLGYMFQPPFIRLQFKFMGFHLPAWDPKSRERGEKRRNSLINALAKCNPLYIKIYVYICHPLL